MDENMMAPFLVFVLCFSASWLSGNAPFSWALASGVAAARRLRNPGRPIGDVGWDLRLVGCCGQSPGARSFSGRYFSEYEGDSDHDAPKDTLVKCKID